ncbi:phosphate starvation-inducible PhoH-like protein [Natronospira proteinivora]|uniref:PhoH-like protein n=1 Tax=Natronospira proteinivora TaxID=1807133 RepID=A0ABT1GBB2_9GAMM|nr:PhoH family protein [Natronospira proteinivora]MCP1728581.1 phosphate starvation-inducible PhoH-like protein [Natronospira proteinivora]
MNAQPRSLDISLEPVDNRRLANLCGQFDEHLRQVERRLGVEINNRGNHFRVIGDEGPVDAAGQLLRALYDSTEEHQLSPEAVHLRLQDSGLEALVDEREHPGQDVAVQTRRGKITGRGPAQKRYLYDMQRSDLSFGIGPAGTGKTYLAVASAVEALDTDQVRRLILVRPAVEAGERLGFLPGDMAQKVDPYLRPMYDALYEMLGFERVNRLIERQVIEVAPLAFMRGRTLNESFIILDEAQNTSVEQMKMFLTRIGFGSRAVVTGDVTQIDLPRNQTSGLRHAVEVLKDVEDVSFTFFTAKDVVRHPLVQKIVTAYERHTDQ